MPQRLSGQFIVGAVIAARATFFATKTGICVAAAILQYMATPRSSRFDVGQQALGFPPDDFVALAAFGLEAGTVKHRDAPARVFDQAQLLQLAGTARR